MSCASAVVRADAMARDGSKNAAQGNPGRGSTPQPRGDGPDRSSDRGAALIIVLWTMALLSILLVAFANNAQIELAIARNQLNAARARAAADAGVAVALVGLTAATTASPAVAGAWPDWAADDREHVVVHDGVDVRVRVVDEGGKIDLNAAPEANLRGLFVVLGAASGDAARLSAAVKQWKADRQALLRPLQWARRSAPAYDQPAGPFFAMEELQRVPGMTRAAYDLIAPFITVHSRSTSPDIRTAPPEVLRSLPNVAPAQVEAWLTERAQAAAPEPATGALLGGPFRTNLSRPVVTIRAEAVTPGGASFVREAVAAVTGDPQEPFRILAWRQAIAAPAASR